MKKIFNTLLSAVLMAAFVLSFTGCNKANDNKDDTTFSKQQSTEKEKKDIENSEENKNLAAEAAKGFMDAYCDLDFEKLSTYCLDAETVKESIPFTDVRQGFKNSFMQGAGAEIAQFESHFDPLIDVMADKIISGMEYEITDTREDGGNYVHTVSFTMIAVSDMNTAVNGAVESIDMEAVGEELTNELIASGTVDETSTEEEIANALMKAYIDRVIAQVTKALDALTPVTTEVELVTVEADGKWLVDTDKGNANELLKIVSSL